MALRVARGLFRLWLVLSVLWTGGIVMWWTLAMSSSAPPQYDPRMPPVPMLCGPGGYFSEKMPSPRIGR